MPDFQSGLSADWAATSKGPSINVNFDGYKEIAGVVSALENAIRGSKLHTYFADAETMVKRLNIEYANFNRTLSQTDASNFLSILNILKSQYGDGLSNIVTNLNDINNAAARAIEEFGNIGASSSEIAGYASAMEAAKRAGIDLTAVLSDFSRIGTIAEGAKDAERLADELAKAQRRISEFDPTAIDGMKKQIRDLTWSVDAAVEKARTEFRSFLSVNQISEYDSDYNSRFEEIFENIRDGTYSGSEAIAAFKRDYSELLQTINGSSVNADVIKGFQESITTLIKSVSDLQEQITKMQNAMTGGGPATEATREQIDDLSNSLIRGKQVTEEQQKVLDSVLQSSSGFQYVCDLMIKFSESIGSAGNEGQKSLQPLSELLGIIRDLSNANVDNLTMLSSVLANIGSMKSVTISAKSFQNLTDGLRNIGDLSNLQSLTRLSTINFSNLGEMKVSKASLRNLSEYIPQLAAIDVTNIKKLAAISWENLNNLKVSKASIESVRELVDAVNAIGDINKIRQLLQDTVNTGSESGSVSDKVINTSDVQRYESALHKVNSALIQYQTLRERYNTDAFAGNESVGTLSGVIDRLTALREELGTGTMKTSEFSRALAEIKIDAGTAEEALKNLNDKILGGGATDAQTNTLAKNITTQIGEVSRLIDTYTTKGFGGSQQVSNLQNLLTQLRELQTAFANPEGPGMTKSQVEEQLSGIAAAAKTAKVELDGMARAAGPQTLSKDSAEYQKIALDIEHAMTQISIARKTMMDSGKDANSDEIKQIDELRAKYEALMNSLTGKTRSQATGELGVLNKELRNFNTSLKETNSSSSTLSSKFKEIARHFTYMFSGVRLAMTAVRQVKQMVNTAIELDDAMTQLRIVTQTTESEYEKFGHTISDTAKRIGASTTDLINSTTTFARLGYTLSESASLAEYTSKLSNVGDIDTSAAQDAMTAIIKAYDKDVSELETIMDKMVVVGR